MNLDRFGVVQILQGHDSLNEEGLGILKVEVEKDPGRNGGESSGAAGER